MVVCVYCISYIVYMYIYIIYIYCGGKNNVGFFPCRFFLLWGGGGGEMARFK